MCCIFQELQNRVDTYFRRGHRAKNMISRLIRPVARCLKYELCLSVFKNREHYLRIEKQNYTDGPIMVNIGLDEQEPAPSLIKLMYNEVREGMTIIAEGKDNCIVGAAINAGSCPWDPDKFVEFARCCECGPIRDVIEFEAYVTCKPNLWERYCVLKIFECSYLAVRPDFRNQGIARRLMLDSWYLARDCGYRLFRVDCSNRYVTRIAEGFGWKRVCTIPFHEYVKDDKLVFKYIKEPHTHVQIYIDQVAFCKDYCPPYNKCKTTSAPKISKKDS